MTAKSARKSARTVSNPTGRKEQSAIAILADAHPVAEPKRPSRKERRAAATAQPTFVGTPAERAAATFAEYDGDVGATETRLTAQGDLEALESLRTMVAPVEPTPEEPEAVGGPDGGQDDPARHATDTDTDDVNVGVNVKAEPPGAARRRALMACLMALSIEDRKAAGLEVGVTYVPVGKGYPRRLASWVAEAVIVGGKLPTAIAPAMEAFDRGERPELASPKASRTAGVSKRPGGQSFRALFCELGMRPEGVSAAEALAEATKRGVAIGAYAANIGSLVCMTRKAGKWDITTIPQAGGPARYTCKPIPAATPAPAQAEPTATEATKAA